MAQLIGIVGQITLLIAVGLYANFVLRRIAGINLRSPTKTPWPRGWRLVYFWLALGISVAVLVPAAILVFGYLLDMDSCPAHLSPHNPWRCTPVGRLVLMAAILAVGLPLAALWTRLLIKLTLKQS